MGALALMMFVALFAFGQRFVGWADPHGKVQLALFATFLFGIICGWQTRGPGAVRVKVDVPKKKPARH